MFREILELLKAKQDDEISIDFIMDSQNSLNVKGINQTIIYDFEFFLEILKQCYSTKEVKILLMRFKLENVIPNKFDSKNYSSILKLIENKTEILTDYCGPKDNKEKYLILFYTLLLYFRLHYETEEVKKLISKKELWKYFIKILVKENKFFRTLELTNELIKEMLNQTPISYEIISGTLYYLKSF